MGAQIAAHLANAGVPVILYDLAAKEGDPNGHIKQSLKQLAKLKPAPFGSTRLHGAIDVGNYDSDLERLGECNLIIEAITERLDWKHDLYNKIAPHLATDAVLATNTSGIPIAALGEGLPDALRQRFCGLHFFNPPRYMHLLELIPHKQTRPEVLDTLEGFLTSALGKGVIHAKDSPNFIGNRVGLFSMLAVMHHAERLDLPLDLVDKLTGPGIGRPKSATFRTADVVGLDTFGHVVQTLADTLPDDPWHSYYTLPAWVNTLIEQGALGQKSGAGMYKKERKEIHVFEPKKLSYRRVQSALDDEVRAILKERDPVKKYAALTACKHPQAEFLISIFRDLFHYCAVLLSEIAHNARDLDLAMRWGYGWQFGPFETWQAAGWQTVAKQLQADIDAGLTMANTPLPDWVMQREGVHEAGGSWSAQQGQLQARSQHPVYSRQLFPERVLTEPESDSATLLENEAIRLWHQDDGIAVLSFNTKMHTVSDAVLDGVLQAVELAERDFKALILWQQQAPFCAGANLQQVISAAKAGEFERLRNVVANFQRASMALKHSAVPTVAAVHGLALGGGCEFILHSDRAVAAMESYIGLVEVGVGLIPGAGGSKEMALRAADHAKGKDLFPFLAQNFEQIAMAKVASSALEARDFGYLRHGDPVVFNANEVLYVAKRQAEALYESGYRPPLRRNDIPVAGDSGIATLKGMLVNMLEGGFISPHDYEIGGRLATVMCGGEVVPGSLVSDDWLLQLELDHFMALLKMDKTQDRIQHMLETGKPLRN